MTDYKRILIATDFADDSEAAREYATALALAYGAELHVLYVQVLLADNYSWFEYAILADADRVMAEKAAERSFAPKETGLDVVEATRRDIAAAPAILAYAEEHKIDLIVIGSHRRTGVARWFLGSVAAEVVRSAPMPVLVVGPEHTYLGEADSILAAVDFSDSSVAALQAAARIAHEGSAKLVVIHVIEPLKLPPYYTTEFQEAGRLDARRALEAKISEMKLPVPAEIVVASGRAHEQINEAAREHAAGLIVVGTRGLHGLEHVLLGSVADRVLRTSPCPVLAHR